MPVNMSGVLTLPFMDFKLNARSPLPSPLLSSNNRNNKSTGSTETPLSSSPGSLLQEHLSPVLRTFATRFLNSVSASTSSFGSLFQPSTPGSELESSVEDLKQNQVTLPARRDKGIPKLEFIEFRREQRPKLPFCEDYDGVNMRRTKTISESIVQLLEGRWEKGETETIKKYHSKANEANCMASAYFDRLQVIREMKEPKFGRTTAENVESNESSNFKSTSNEKEDNTDLIEEENMQKMDNSLMRSKRSIWAKKYKVIKVPSEEYYSLFDERGIEDATIDLKFKYDMDSEILEVTIERVEDVTNLRNNNKLINSFVQLSMYQRNGRRKQKTKTAKQCRDPIFNQTFKIGNVTEKWFHVECLHIELYQKKRFKSIRVGETFVWLDDLDLFCNDNVSITERFNPCC